MSYLSHNARVIYKQQ